MSFARSKRGSIFDDEIKNKENLPGPNTYTPRNASHHINGFKYVDTTSMSSILERSQDDIDIHLGTRNRNISSTPVKRKPPTKNQRPNPNVSSIMNRTVKSSRAEIAQMRELKADNEKMKIQYQKVSDLKDELEQDYVALRERNQQAAVIEARLKEQIENKDREIHELKSELQLSEEKLSDLRQREENSHKENVEQQSKNLDLMKRCESDEAKIKELRALVEQKSGELEKLRLEQFNNDEETKTFQIKLKKLQAQFDEERARFIAEIRDQKADMAQLKSSLQERNVEIDSLNEQQVEKYELTQQYMATAEKVESDNNLLIEERDQFAAENKNLLFQIEEFKIAQTDQISQLDELRVESEAVKADHEKELEDLKESVLANSKKYESQIEELEKGVELAATSHESQSAENVSKLSEMQAEIDALQQTIGQKDFELENAMKSAEDFQATLNRHEEECRKAAENLVSEQTASKQLKSELKSVQSAVESAENKIKEERAKFEKALEEQKLLVTESEAKRTEQEQKGAQLLAINKGLMAKIAELNADSEKFKVELKESEDAKKPLVERNEELAKTVTAKVEEVGQVQREFARCVQTNKKLKGEKEMLRQASVDYKAKRDKLKASLDELKAELATERLKKKEDTELVSRLTAEADENKRLHVAAQGKIKQVTDELRLVRAESTNNKISKEAHDKRLVEIDQLEAQLSAAKLSGNVWKEKFEELENFVSPFRQDLAKYAEESRHMTDKDRKNKKELAELHNKLAQQMGHQNQRQKIHYLTKIKGENSDLKEQLDQSQLELKKSRRQIESLQDDINALRGVRRFDPKKAFNH